MTVLKTVTIDNYNNCNINNVKNKNHFLSSPESIFAYSLHNYTEILCVTCL